MKLSAFLVVVALLASSAVRECDAVVRFEEVDFTFREGRDMDTIFLVKDVTPDDVTFMILFLDLDAYYTFREARPEYETTFRELNLTAAEPDVDFVKKNITVTFPANDEEFGLEINDTVIIDDNIFEPEESFVMVLDSTTDGVIDPADNAVLRFNIIDDDEPECEILVAPPFGTVTQTGIDVGDTATYTCDPGFELMGDMMRTCVLINDTTAAFDGTQPVCRPLQCEILVDPPFGTVTQTGIDIGDTATYTCDPGFELVGDMMRTCVQTSATTAAFDGTQPVCRSLQCEMLVDPPFGTVTQTGRDVGDTATYTCDPGFELVGDMMRTCIQTGATTAEFDGTQPVCRPICDVLDDPANGMVVQTGVSVSSSATYTCDPGFRLVGADTRNCLQVSPSDAEWSGQAPTCEPTCDQPPAPNGGSVTQTNGYIGDIIMYSCDPGYELNGERMRECVRINENTAIFDGMAPTCEFMIINGVGGDPHFSIMLPTGQLLCFSVQGEKNFPFNLISNDLLQMNAFFIEDAVREEITWIGSLGVVVQHSHYKKSNATKIRFDAHEQMIYINNEVNLHAKKVEKLTLANGKLTISEAVRKDAEKNAEVEVNLVDVGLTFSVTFVKKRHLDMSWKEVAMQANNSHGIIGQFMRQGVWIDEAHKLLYLPSLRPVPVMRSSVWHFMERDIPDPDQKFCWQSMNPGYQGKRLIEGTYLDYLVDDVLSSGFKFKGQ